MWLGGEEVSLVLAFTAGGAELGSNGVGGAADGEDFFGREDIDLDGEGCLGAAGAGFEDPSRGSAVSGGDIHRDNKGGLRDGLSGEEVVLKELDDGKLGSGLSACGDVADAYPEDLGGVVLL